MKLTHLMINVDNVNIKAEHKLRAHVYIFFFFFFTKMYTSAFVYCTVLTQSCKDLNTVYTVEEDVVTISKMSCR